MKRKIVAFDLIFLICFCHGIIGPLSVVNGNVRLLHRRSFDDELAPIKRGRTSHVILIFGHVVRRLGSRHLQLHRRGRFLSLLIDTSPVKIIVLALSKRVSVLGTTTLHFLSCSSSRRIENQLLYRLTSPLTRRVRHVPGSAARAVHLDSSVVCHYSQLSFISENFSRPFVLIRDLASRIIGTRGGTCRGIVHVVTRRIGGAATNVASALSAISNTLRYVRSARSLHRIVGIYVRHYCDVDHFVAGFTGIIGVPRPRLRSISLGSHMTTYGAFVRAIYHGHGVALRLSLYGRGPRIVVSASLFRRMLIGVVGGTTRDVKRAKSVFVHASMSPAVLRVTSANTNVDGRIRAGLFDPFFSAGPGKRNVNLVFVHRILVGRKYAFSLHACPSGLAHFHVHF